MCMHSFVHYVTIVFICVALPFVTYADVIISEVAWMGTHTSPNHEWIELHNAGASSVSLDGWRLSAVDGSPNISLSGTIAAGGYFLLERTSDESVPGIPADLIYTGALGNRGEILELYDAEGRLADRVDGSDNWAIGGDNTTKDTLQRIGDGWVTARPTPRAPNTTEATEVDDEGSTTRVSAAPRVVAQPTFDRGALTRVADPLFSVDMGGDRQAHLGMPITFVARAHSGSRELVGGVAYQWNMGDGTVYRGAQVRHMYTEPGTYIVALEGRSTLFREEKRAHATVVVTVEEPAFAVRSVTDTYIEIHNESAEMADLSGMSLVIGAEVSRFPPHTYIAGEQSVRLSRRALGLTGNTSGSVMVLNTEKHPIAAYAMEPTDTTRASVETEPDSRIAASLAQMNNVQTAPSVPMQARPPSLVDRAPEVASYEAEQEHIHATPSQTDRSQYMAAAGALPHTGRDAGLFAWIGLLLAVVAGASVLVVQLGRSQLSVPHTNEVDIAPPPTIDPSANTLPTADAFTIVEVDSLPPDTPR